MASTVEVVSKEGFRSGRWSSLRVSGWPDNDSCRNLLAWQWEGDHHRHLVVVNFSDTPADGLIHMEGTAGADWGLTDLLDDGHSYQRVGADMDPAGGKGLYVSRGRFGAHLFRLARITNASLVRPRPLISSKSAAVNHRLQRALGVYSLVRSDRERSISIRSRKVTCQDLRLGGSRAIWPVLNARTVPVVQLDAVI